MNMTAGEKTCHNKHLFIIMNRISQEFTFIVMQSCEQKSLKLSNGISHFKSNYSTMKTNLCRFQKCEQMVNCGMFSHPWSHIYIFLLLKNFFFKLSIQPQLHPILTYAWFTRWPARERKTMRRWV